MHNETKGNDIFQNEACGELTGKIQTRLTLRANTERADVSDHLS